MAARDWLGGAMIIAAGIWSDRVTQRARLAA